MEIPISGALKRRSERDTAQLEDAVVGALFSATNKIALHGGTAVWRCYGGKRFSKDVDVYIWAKNFKEIFITAMEREGVETLKYREKGVTFVHVRKGNTEIKVEPRNVEKAAVIAPYERVDGTRMNILALSVEDIILEKIDTYRSRRAYKDLYDITVLLNSVKDEAKVKKALHEFAKAIPDPDESFQTYTEFRTLIYSGIVPDFEKMADLIKRWVM